ncbi:unnamed protein product, partial [Onchocerca ochengi]
KKKNIFQGVGTALCGKETAMACTTAVEELIGEHYNQQLMELLDDDPVDHGDLLKAPRYDMLKWIIQTGCKGAIWLAERV